MSAASRSLITRQLGLAARRGRCLPLAYCERGKPTLLPNLSMATPPQNTILRFLGGRKRDRAADSLVDLSKTKLESDSDDDLVILTREEYEKQSRKARSAIPTVVTSNTVHLGTKNAVPATNFQHVDDSIASGTFNSSGNNTALRRPTIDSASRVLSKQLVVVLCGIPGSGKSTFADHVTRNSNSLGSTQYFDSTPLGPLWCIINQDTLKTRKKCETLTRKALEEGTTFDFAAYAYVCFIQKNTLAIHPRSECID